MPSLEERCRAAAEEIASKIATLTGVPKEQVRELIKIGTEADTPIIRKHFADVEELLEAVQNMEGKNHMIAVDYERLMAALAKWSASPNLRPRSPRFTTISNPNG